VDLTLKVITHYGECTPMSVQHFEKLFGKDVIVAHQLLKNDIPQHEYWLVTHDLHMQPAELTQWMQWQTSSKETERGDIRFSYTQLLTFRANFRGKMRMALRSGDEQKNHRHPRTSRRHTSHHCAPQKNACG
jgi:hypothetical protein